MNIPSDAGPGWRATARPCACRTAGRRRHRNRWKAGPAGASAGRPAAAGRTAPGPAAAGRSEEHTSELQSHLNLVCRLLLEKKKKHDKLEPSQEKERTRR